MTTFMALSVKVNRLRHATGEREGEDGEDLVHGLNEVFRCEPKPRSRLWRGAVLDERLDVAGGTWRRGAVVVLRVLSDIRRRDERGAKPVDERGVGG